MSDKEKETVYNHLLHALTVMVYQMSELPTGVPVPVVPQINMWDLARDAIREAHGMQYIQE